MKLSKRNRRLIISLISVLVLAFASRYLPPSQNIENLAQQKQPGLYKVTKFIDGDTIIVDMDGKAQTIRFIGVDTPEEFDSRKPVQCFAKAAAQHTKDLIGNDGVRLESDPQSDNRDRYDRLLRFVYTSSGTLVNYQIVADGYGFTTTGFPFTRMDDFRAAQNKARQENKGLWGDCQINYPKGYPQTNPVAPAPSY
jgi:micrococcal nuclease